MPTFETVRLHEWAKGFCIHCGGKETYQTDVLTCLPRQREAKPRERPASFDALPWEIGDRMKVIMDEEAKALAGSAQMAPDREPTPHDHTTEWIDVA